jgi:hypothetical protein
MQWFRLWMDWMIILDGWMTGALFIRLTRKNKKIGVERQGIRPNHEQQE